MKGKDFFDMTVGIAAVLLSVLLFSCSSDDSLEHVAYGLADNICFGVSDLDNGTRANIIQKLCLWVLVPICRLICTTTSRL